MLKMEDRLFEYRNDETGTFFRHEHSLDPRKLSVDISSLKKESFDYIGKWLEIKVRPEWSLFYRRCKKSGLTDQDGDPKDLHVFFYALFVENGYMLQELELKNMYEDFKKTIQISTQLLSSSLENSGRSITSVITPAPDYMMKELEDLVRGR